MSRRLRVSSAAVLVVLSATACGDGGADNTTGGNRGGDGGNGDLAASDCPSTYPGFNAETGISYDTFAAATATFAWGETVTAAQYYTETSPAMYSVSEPRPFTPGPDASFDTIRGESANIARPNDACIFAIDLTITGPVDGENDGDTTRYDPFIFPAARDGQVAQIYVYDPDNGADSIQVDVPEGETVTVTWAFVAPTTGGTFEVLGPSTNESDARARITDG